MEQEYFNHLEELERDELYLDDVLYHFKTALELERDGEEVDFTEIEEIYEHYKRYKAQKLQVKFLKAIYQPEQRTHDWYEMRKGMITASDIAAVVGECPYGNDRKVLMKKAGLSKDEFTGNFSTEWGVKYEPIACQIYEMRTKSHINAFGLLPHYSNFQPQDEFLLPITYLGASPDGIRDDGIMLEIKCPTSREITGIPPRYYWVQMQIQMECCNLDMCHFLECKFTEYALQDDFLNHLHSNENEKGVVALDEATHKYMYLFPLPKKISDIKKWCEEHNGHKLTYFELEKYSCVEVKRDSDWFHSVFPKIRSFWREVLDARKHPEKYLKKEKDKAEKLTTSTKTVVRRVKKEACKIEFDQFEQLEDETKTICLTDEQLNELYDNTYGTENDQTAITKETGNTCFFEDSNSD
jgi:putative phage-type endonuclease